MALNLEQSGLPAREDFTSLAKVMISTAQEYPQHYVVMPDIIAGKKKKRKKKTIELEGNSIGCVISSKFQALFGP